MEKLFGCIGKLEYVENSTLKKNGEEHNFVSKYNNNNKDKESIILSDKDKESYSKSNETVNEIKESNQTRVIFGIWSTESEYVHFPTKLHLDGKVEVWLNNLAQKLKEVILFYMQEAIKSYEENQKELWLSDYPAQVAIIANQIAWSTEVEMAFLRYSQGYENSLKLYQKKKISQLNSLIQILSEELSKSMRCKILSVCTLDIHSRDIVYKLIDKKV